MRFPKSGGVLIGLILFSGIAATVKAQGFVEPVPSRGFMPSHDQLSSSIDNIDIATGKLNLTIPLGTLPNSSGGIGYTFNLYYESNIFDMVTNLEVLSLNPNDIYDLTHIYSATLGATPHNDPERRGGWRYSTNDQYYTTDDHMTITTDGPFLESYINVNNVCMQSIPTDYYRNRLIFPDGGSRILYRFYTPSDPYNYNWPKENHDGFYVEACTNGRDWRPIMPPAYTLYADDGTYLYGGTGGYYFPDGRRLSWNNYRLREYDSNGNYLEFTNSGVSNSSGQEISVNTGIVETYNGKKWRRDTVTIPGPNGDIVYSIDWEHIIVGGNGAPLINYNSPQLNSYGQTTPYPEFRVELWVIRCIQLPLAAHVGLAGIASGVQPPGYNSYYFDYNGGKYRGDTVGLLSYMRTPSGSEHEYEYEYHNGFTSDGPVSVPGYSYPVWFADDYGDIPILVKKAYVSKKTVTHDNSEQVWEFGRSTDTSSNLYVLITNPDGGKTKHTYNNYSLFHYQGSTEILIEYLAANGTTKLLEKKRRFGRPSFPPEKEIESVFDESGGNGKSAITTYSHDENGNLLEKIEYDWVNYGIETGSIIKRKTTYNYYIHDISSSPNNINYKKPLSTIYPSYWPSGGPRRLDAVKRMTVYERNSAGNLVAKAATEYEYDNPYTKGNVRYERRWDSVKTNNVLPMTVGSLTSSNSQVFEYVYDIFGNVIDIYEPSVTTVSTDRPRTHITYDQTGSRVEKVETGYGTNEKRTVQYIWTGNGAALWTTWDVENNLGTVYVYDSAGRVIEAVEISGNTGLRGTQTIYDDANRRVTVKGDLKADGDGLLWTRTHYDQLGRVSLMQQSDGSALVNNDSGIKVKTIYSYPATGGRMVLTTSPYRTMNEATFEWSCTQYDTLGRVARVSAFKGGSTQPSNCSSTTNRTGTTTMLYGAEWTSVTDPAGKQRKQRVDVFGRLVEVTEDPSGLNYVTIYEYDMFGNLTKVTQGGQTRTFSYSSLSRLLSATNPESGTTSYTYYGSGDLATKKDARNVTSTMTYDVLHRIKTKSYSDLTSAVTYTYHQVSNGSAAPNIGQLKSVISSESMTTYSYNALGQVATSSQAITGRETNSFSYDWYLNGALKKQVYPSGNIVNYPVDNAGRTTGVAVGSTYYASVLGHTPDGRITDMALGNGLYEKRDYWPAGTPTTYSLRTTPGGGVLTELKYHFAASTNNGNVMKQEITRKNGSASTTTTWTQNYTYDGVNRLSAANETGGWSRTYGYDQYGNRRIASSSGITNNSSPSEPTLHNHFTAANNRLNMTGVSYDAAGNQTAYDGLTLEYDAEGRNTKAKDGNVDYVTFAYDGEGRRVKKVSGGITTYYVYDALGQLAAEYSDLAPTNTGVSYLYTDMLGSVRTITDSNGAVVECYDYLPFGRMLTSADNGRNAAGCYPAAPDPANSRAAQKFTGKERDAETGLDYFGARYMSGPEGRFMSPDPLMISAQLEYPQTWNRYVYARNNPLMFIDPTGLFESPAYDCEEDNDACLNDEQRRILTNSIVKLGGKYYYGKNLWDKLVVAQQNAFVNITNTLGSIILDDGTTALSRVQGVTTIFEDRILGIADGTFLDGISNNSLFNKANGSLHGEFSNSFKSNKSLMSQGNIQMSFAKDESFDADHDLFKNPILHFLGEVIPNHSMGAINKVFGTNLPAKTNQDSVRRMLMANPNIGITPSTESKFNRR